MCAKAPCWCFHKMTPAPPSLSSLKAPPSNWRIKSEVCVGGSPMWIGECLERGRRVVIYPWIAPQAQGLKDRVQFGTRAKVCWNRKSWEISGEEEGMTPRRLLTGKAAAETGAGPWKWGWPSCSRVSVWKRIWAKVQRVGEKGTEERGRWWGRKGVGMREEARWANRVWRLEGGEIAPLRAQALDKHRRRSLSPVPDRSVQPKSQTLYDDPPRKTRNVYACSVSAGPVDFKSQISMLDQWPLKHQHDQMMTSLYELSLRHIQSPSLRRTRTTRRKEAPVQSNCHGCQMNIPSPLFAFSTIEGHIQWPTSSIRLSCPQNTGKCIQSTCSSRVQVLLLQLCRRCFRFLWLCTRFIRHQPSRTPSSDKPRSWWLNLNPIQWWRRQHPRISKTLRRVLWLLCPSLAFSERPILTVSNKY